MAESMTGTARVQGRVGGINVSIFVRSLNAKFLDFHFRMPSGLQAMEEGLADRLRATFVRGRIDVEINGDFSFSRPRLNRPVFEEYRKIIRSLGGDPAAPESMPVLLKMPGVMRLEESPTPDLARDAFWKLFDRALTRLRAARRKEGKRIEKLFRRYLKRIDSLAGKIKVRQDRSRPEGLRKFRSETERVAAASGSTRAGADALAQAYLEWFDKFTIVEELERIRMHTAEIFQLLAGDGAIGRQIDFYCQELQREVNTIGSKARDFQIRKYVVEIKTIIEDMKEQVRNVC